jgi:hypothetical protein
MGFEQVAQILLDQALSRLTATSYDILLDALCDHDGCGFSRRRRRNLAGFGRLGDRAFGWLSDHYFPDTDDVLI